MPWNEVKTVDLRREFVALAIAKDCSFSDLCVRYNISRKTGYKWLKRFQEAGVKGLNDQSRAPLHRPTKTSHAVEQQILSARELYPDWGARKLRRVLSDKGSTSLPSPSTITEILRRHGQLHPHDSPQANFIRFEHPYPNDLWQMDFKGHFALPRGRCHPLTVLDDHSRFSLCLHACANETRLTVQNQLIQTFRRYGLPRRMTMDNGPPWGSADQTRFTQFTVWLIEQGIRVSHSRPYHPQTQGKDERFHRTLKAELLGRRQLESLTHCQEHFNQWRVLYNTVRPHEALGMDTPAAHYQPSQHRYQERQPAYEYSAEDAVRKVGRNLSISFQGYEIFVGQAFLSKSLAVRPTLQSGHYTLYFCHQEVLAVDLNTMVKRKR